MTFQSVTNAASAEVLWTYGSLHFENVLWFTKAGFDTVAMDALADAIIAATLGTNILSVMDDDWSLGSVLVTDQRTEGADQVSVAATGKVGTVASETIARNLALVVTLRTGLRGRSYRGRVYIPGMPESLMTNGAYAASVSTEVLEWLQLIKNNAATEGWTWGVCSRYHDGVERAAGIVTPITSHEVRSTYPGTQRRRFKRP